MTTETNRVWFTQPLETVATWWRILRRDGVTLGFTTHDRDLWLDGVNHRAAPGMTPSAIRRSADFEPDSAEIAGALSHDSITDADLALGRYDGARVLVGIADWESGAAHLLYRGTIGAVSEEAGAFSAQLVSRKSELQLDPVPRTSPFCRAAFCGPGCTLSAARFEHEVVVGAVDEAANTVTFAVSPDSSPVDPALLAGGTVRWFDGPHAGATMGIAAVNGAALVLDTQMAPGIAAGQRARLRQGCDHTLETCAARFANAVNFQGEPFVPGNDLLARYPSPAA